MPADAAHVWVHNLNPFLIHFSGNFGIRWYGLAYMVGFMVGWAIAINLVKRGRGMITADEVTDFTTYVVLGVMIGGRLGYALFYAPELLTQFSKEFPYWGVLQVWQGGMASHGGMIGVLVACWLFSWRRKVSFMHIGDLTVIGGGIGIFFGRIANFINGELMGRACDPSLPWAVKFPADVFKWMGDPAKVGASEVAKLAQIGPVTAKLGIAPEQWMSIVRTYRERLPGWPQAQGQISSMLDTVVQSIQNGNEDVRMALAPFLEPRHPSQLYEALLEGFLCTAVVLLAWRKPQKPGFVGALFLTVYAAVRILGEHFRLPDAHIGYQFWGLTRGQWLSFAMLLAAAAVLVYAWRRPAEKIGGWGPIETAPSGRKGKGSKARKRS